MTEETTGKEKRALSFWERLLTSKPLTPWRAGSLIAMTSLTLTLLGGALVWLLDKDEMGGFGDCLWWALQTVTTVGYGDIVPEDPRGRIVGAVLMLNGIALIGVITAAVTAVLIEQARRRRSMTENQDLKETLERIESRLSRIEASLDDSPPR